MEVVGYVETKRVHIIRNFPAYTCELDLNVTSGQMRSHGRDHHASPAEDNLTKKKECQCDEKVKVELLLDIFLSSSTFRYAMYMLEEDIEGRLSVSWRRIHHIFV